MKIVILDAEIWTCLCWVGILFSDFFCPPWFPGECVGCMLPGREFFWDPDMCGHWDFQIKVFIGIGSCHLEMEIV